MTSQKLCECLCSIVRHISRLFPAGRQKQCLSASKAKQQAESRRPLVPLHRPIWMERAAKLRATEAQ